MANLTLLDIAQRNKNPEEAIIEQGVLSIPEVSLIPAKIIDTLSFWRTMRTSRPSGAFRNINAGVVPSKSTYTSKEVACKLFTSIMSYDKDLERVDTRGDLENSEMAGAFTAALESHAKAFWYGRDAVNGVADAFDGLIDLVSSTMVYDATGTTVGGGSSAWLVCVGDGKIQHVFGGGNAFMTEPWTTQYFADPADSTKLIPKQTSSMSVYSGVDCSDQYAFGRIKNLTAETNHKLTFAMMDELKSQFPTGTVPFGNITSTNQCFWFMPKRAYKHLQQSLTAASPTGMPAPFPKADNDGIPIYVTDALTITETIA